MTEVQRDAIKTIVRSVAQRLVTDPKYDPNVQQLVANGLTLLEIALCDLNRIADAQQELARLGVISAGELEKIAGNTEAIGS